MKKICGFLVGILLVGCAAAQQVNPDTLVKDVTNEVLNSVSKDQAIQHGSTAKAIELVNDKVSPAFDFQRMTALALGKGWRQANAEQKLALTDEFKTLLVRTYSVALTSYKNQTIEFKPTKVTTDETDVTVRSSIKQPGNKSISMDYSMEKVGTTWKVYDIVVDGISLVMNFRSQFEQEVLSGGIDGLIKSLHVKNGSKAASIAKK
jgi:phospholipid transport system substrate-binding protein